MHDDIYGIKDESIKEYAIKKNTQYSNYKSSQSNEDDKQW